MKKPPRTISIDPEALIASARSRSATRSSRGSGAMHAIAHQTATIEALRGEGATWDEIAAALAEQGVTQGRDRVPITGRRVTALRDSIRRKQEAKARRDARLARYTPRHVPEPVLIIKPAVEPISASDPLDADAGNSFEARQAARLEQRFKSVQQLLRRDED